LYNGDRKWLPSCRVLKLIATKLEREDILTNHLKPGKFDVCLTSYEGINICKSDLKKFHWKYIIIDEAHKIKNEESLISRVIIFQKILKNRMSEISRPTIKSS
jgi:SWI/SNF-related matrix-associated actin-dependent regulator of chromatin subfamily A member 5